MTMNILPVARTSRIAALVTFLGAGTPAGTLQATLVYGTDVTAANGGLAGNL